MTFYIGRNPENTIVLNDPSVSGRHAELTLFDDGRILFKDYSTNGSYVNGQFVNQASVYVSFGDSIIFPGNILLDWAQVSAAQPVHGSASARNDGGTQCSTSWPGNIVSLNFSRTLGESFSIGYSNVWNCGVTAFLWLITCWIPYLNIGTYYGLIAMMNAWAKGETFKPTDIFDSKYRRMMPELLLTSTFRGFLFAIGILAVIPAVVMLISTMFSTLIVIDRGHSPVDAIRESNRITYGSKWTIFGTMFVILLIMGLVSGILAGIFALVGLAGPVEMAVAIVLEILVCVFAILPVYCGLGASMWRQLSQNL